MKKNNRSSLPTPPRRRRSAATIADLTLAIALSPAAARGRALIDRTDVTSTNRGV